jgi:tellurium resistance protein TerD
MTIRLSKGDTINLNNTAAALSTIICGLGWDINKKSNADFDLDVSVLLLNDDGELSRDENFIFYGNLSDPSGAVTSSGDNRTGEGEGYDEKCTIKLVSVPKDVQSIVIIVSIDQYKERNQNFGQIINAKCDVLNGDNNKKLISYDLTEDMSTGTGVVVCQFEREDGSWRFIALGSSVKGGLPEILKRYGVKYE